MANPKKVKAVAPKYRERIEMAMRCRHGLSSTQRSVLVVIAMRCALDKPTESFVSIEYIAQLTGYSTRTVDRSLEVLIEKRLIRRHLRGPIGISRRTVMNWPLICQDTFEFQRPEYEFAAEDAALEGFADDAEEARGFELEDHSVADDDEMDDLTSKPSADHVIDEALKNIIEDNIETRAMPYGAAHLIADAVTGWNQAAASRYCTERGYELTTMTGHTLDGEGKPCDLRLYRIALPIHEYAAKRLSKYTGRVLTPSSFASLRTKKDDPYSVVEHAMLTETWCTWLREKANTPAGYLVSQWDNIADSWKAAGSLTQPPYATDRDLDEGGAQFTHENGAPDVVEPQTAIEREASGGTRRRRSAPDGAAARSLCCRGLPNSAQSRARTADCLWMSKPLIGHHPEVEAAESFAMERAGTISGSIPEPSAMQSAAPGPDSA